MYTLSLPPNTRLSSIDFSDTTIQTQFESYSFFLLPILYDVFLLPIPSPRFYLFLFDADQVKSSQVARGERVRGWWCDHSRGGSPSRKACLGGGPWRRAATRACFVTLAASSIINTRTQPRKRTCHSNPHNTRISITDRVLQSGYGQYCRTSTLEAWKQA